MALAAGQAASSMDQSMGDAPQGFTDQHMHTDMHQSRATPPGSTAAALPACHEGRHSPIIPQQPCEWAGRSWTGAAEVP